RYARSAPQGPILSPDDPRYANAVPSGPVMSPDDPRYGRPAGPPAVIYAERPPGAPQPGAAYPEEDSGGGIRPPGAVGQQPGNVTGAVQQPGGQPGQGADGRPVVLSALPPEEQPESSPANLAPNLRRQEVSFVTKEPPGTLIVDTPHTYLYYVLGN